MQMVAHLYRISAAQVAAEAAGHFTASRLSAVSFLLCRDCVCTICTFQMQHTTYTACDNVAATLTAFLQAPQVKHVSSAHSLQRFYPMQAKKATEAPAATTRPVSVCYADMDSAAAAAAHLQATAAAASTAATTAKDRAPARSMLRSASVLLELAPVAELADFSWRFQLHLAGRQAPESAASAAALRAGLPHSPGREIFVHTQLAVPYQRRPGDPTFGHPLHASYLPSSSSDGSERSWEFVAVDGTSGKRREVWIGALLLIFEYSPPGQPGRRILAAYVRWLKKTEHSAQTAPLKGRMGRFCWEKVKHPMGGRLVPRCDIVLASNILGPAYVQPDPTAPGHYFYNIHTLPPLPTPS